jgi:hypothetical protein
VDIKAALFESGVEIFDDFLSENVGSGKVVGSFAALLASRLGASEISLVYP